MKNRAFTGALDDVQIAPLAERGWPRAIACLKSLQQRVASAEPFLCAKLFSIADIDGLIAIEFAARLPLDRPLDAARARRWHELVASRLSVSA